MRSSVGGHQTCPQLQDQIDRCLRHTDKMMSSNMVLVLGVGVGVLVVLVLVFLFLVF